MDMRLTVPEKSVKHWLAEMKAAGFYGKYVATSGDIVIHGEIPRNIEIENAAIAAAKLEAEKQAKADEIKSYIKKKR